MIVAVLLKIRALLNKANRNHAPSISASKQVLEPSNVLSDSYELTEPPSTQLHLPHHRLPVLHRLFSVLRRKLQHRRLEHLATANIPGNHMRIT